MSPNTKHKLRKHIRMAIKEGNAVCRLSCMQCRYCIDENNRGGYICDEGVVACPTDTLIMVTHTPSCFSLNYADNTYGKIVEWMIKTGHHGRDIGWHTVVRRIITRCNHAGHLMNVRPANLEKFG